MQSSVYKKLQKEDLNIIRDELNYHILMHFEILTVECNTDDLGFPIAIGHRYIVLSYLVGDLRKIQYYDNAQGMPPKQQMNKYKYNMKFVVLHLTQSGIYFKIMDYDDFSIHMKKFDQEKKLIDGQLFNQWNCAGNQADTKDKCLLVNALAEAIEWEYDMLGSWYKLGLDKWNCETFVQFIKKRVSK